MIMPEMVRTRRREIEREIAHLDLVREARRAQSEETSQIAPSSRRIWRWSVKPGAEPTFEALSTWLLAPYATPAPHAQ